jgi:hypothetical protein
MIKTEIDTKAVTEIIKNMRDGFKSGYQGAKAGYFRGDKGKIPDPDNPNQPDIADIAIWNDFGTYNIPPRPFMRTAQVNAVKKCEQATKLLLQEGTEMEDICKKAAQILSAEIKTSIRNGNWDANAPITIQGGWMRNKKSGKLFYVKGKGSSRPLIDTGNLLQSVHTGIIKNGIDIETGK